MLRAVYYHVTWLAIQLWVSVVVLFCPAVAQTTADWNERLRTTFKAWRTELSEVSVVFEYTFTLHGPEGPDQSGGRMSHEIRRSAGRSIHILHQIADEKGVHTGQVWGRNKEYLFELNRTFPQSDWFLSDLYQRSNDRERPDVRLVRQIDRIDALNAWFPFEAEGNPSLLLMMGRSRFELLSAEEVGTVLKARLVTQPDGSEPEGLRKSWEYRVEFDMSGDLVPLRIERSTGFRMEYSDFREVPGLPMKIPFRAAWGNPTSPRIGEWEVTRVEVGTVKEADFRLPAFGLQEPAFAHRGLLWPWLVGLAIVAAVLAIWFVRRSSRK